MRPLIAFTAAILVMTGSASAQTPSVPPSAPSRAAAQPAAAAPAQNRYIEGLGGWTFGDKGSQFFGAEGGFALMRHAHVFVEGGQVLNAGGQAIIDDAETIAAGLGKSVPGVTYDAKQPTFFVDGGLRFTAKITGSKVEPFLLAGAGVAHVKQDVTFASQGTDITGSLSQYGVVLGSDLSGSFTKLQIIIGGGFTIPFHQSLFLEIGYRSSRIFAEDQPININRAGIGFGVRF